MIENVIFSKKLFALIVRSKFRKKKGVNFFTENNAYNIATNLAKKCLINDSSLNKFNSEMLLLSNEINPEPGSVIIFNSKVPHGSPKNESKKIRISFDFRMFSEKSGLGNKDRSNYFRVSNNLFNDDSIVSTNMKWLKYIRGGNGISTTYQHLLIDSFVNAENLMCVEQEAEIETMKHPIITAYLNKAAKIKKIDGIIVFSRKCLPNTLFNRTKNSKKYGIYLAIASENQIILV